MKIDCSNCQAVYFGESKRFLKPRSDEHKRSVRNCNCDKNEIAKLWSEADHNSQSLEQKIQWKMVSNIKNKQHLFSLLITYFCTDEFV